MKASLKWLRDYVEIEFCAFELAGRLTEILTETEAANLRTGDVRGVVAARVVTVEKHPDADKLTVCVMDWGDGSDTVVCGAPNVKAGMICALALPGSTIAGGRRISEATLRGRRSYGMLVSEAELGVGDGVGGIMDLGPHVEPGTDVIEFLGMDEEIIDVDVQANRPDCMGMLGIAREIAAATGGEFRRPSFDLAESDPTADSMIDVTIEDDLGCPRYIARAISGVTVGESPVWLKERLDSVGVRSINNIVDITNFVMLEYGHPVHAFDYDKLHDHAVCIRKARSGEKLVTLDGEERTLAGSHLVICDAAGPVALAGIMGGQASEVTEKTSNVLLECAWFDPSIVRKGAASLALRSDASQRFERGVDPLVMDEVAARACALMSDLAGGTVARGSVSVGRGSYEPVSIRLSVDKVRRMLEPAEASTGQTGPMLDAGIIKRHLEALGFRTEADRSDRDALLVTVPSWRPDVTEPADLIEEVVRLNGYDLVKPEVPFQSLVPMRNEAREAREQIREIMVRLGLFEVINSSFMAEGAGERAGVDASVEAVVLANPVNKETPLLRISLVPGILEVVRVNANAKQGALRIFEIGKTFRREGGAVDERWVLAGALWGPAERPSWGSSARSVDFYDAKGLIEALGEALEVDTLETSCYDGPILDEGASAGLSIGGRPLGCVGTVSHRSAKSWGIPDGVVVFELDVSTLSERHATGGSYEELPRYPASGRDVALVVDAGVAAGEILNEIRKRGGELLVDTSIFDVYAGKQLPAGKKSIGISMTYRSRERTLTDAEVDVSHELIVKHLIEKFSATLRE
jgi:phenylalanyl-tRNA synthetase beta chain